MPLYYFSCPKCQVPTAKVLPREDVCKPQECPRKCGPMVRTPKGPSSAVKERLDNGAMPRAVERYAEAERLFAERAANDPNLKR